MSYKDKIVGQDQKKNVLLLVMSTLDETHRPLPNVYHFANDKNEYYFYGISQLEAETKLVLSLLAEEGKKLDRIVCLCSEKAVTPLPDGGSNDDKKPAYEMHGLSAMEFYKNRMLSYMQTETYGNAGAVDIPLNVESEYDPFESFKYNNEKSKKEIENHPESKIDASLYKNLQEGFFKIIDLEQMDFFMNAVDAIKMEKEDQAVDLYLDMQGGGRSAIAEINAIVELLKTQNVIVKGRYANNYERQNSLHEISEVSEKYSRYDLVSSLQIFTEFGKSDNLTRYFESRKKTEEMQRLLRAIEQASNGISLCNVNKFDEALEEIKDLKWNPENTDSVEKLTFREIKEDYEELLENDSVPSKIRWCLEKGFWQQALTILESQMPSLLNQYVDYTIKDVRCREKGDSSAPFHQIDKSSYSIEQLIKNRQDKDKNFKWMKYDNYYFSVWSGNCLSVYLNGGKEDILLDLGDDLSLFWQDNGNQINLKFKNEEKISWTDEDYDYRASILFRLKKKVNPALFGFFISLHYALKKQRDEVNHSKEGQRVGLQKIKEALLLYLEVEEKLRNKSNLKRIEVIGEKQDKYIFFWEKHGEKKRTRFLDNEIWLDVGNSREDGCIDHHQDHEYRSTFHALLNNLNYLKKLKISAENGKDIYVHLHRFPDLDCIASFYTLKYYLEHTEEEFNQIFGNNEYADKLIAYVNDVDEGKKLNVEVPTLYALISALDAEKKRSEETDGMVMRMGERLFALAVQKVCSEKDFDLYNTDFSAFVGNEYEKVVAFVINDRKKYEKEKQSIVSFEKILMWTSDETYKLVPAAIWKDIPKCYFGYFYARKEQNMLTVCPIEIKGQNGANTTRVIISINPEMNLDNKYTLKPIAEMLEMLEQIEEYRLYQQSGVFRRDYSSSRNDGDLLQKYPFSVTSDPWYLRHGEDILDTPGMHSILAYEDIIEILRNNGSAVKQSFAVKIGDDYHTSFCSELKLKDSSISKWNNQAKSQMMMYNANGISDPIKNKHYMLIYAELDASLIRHSNDILKALCLNVAGKSFYECKESDFIQPDYRTCIYADNNCMVILEADYNGEKCIEDIGLLISNLKSCGKSNVPKAYLIDDIALILKQYDNLQKYSERICSKTKQNQKALERLNEDVLDFSADYQRKGSFTDPVRAEIFDFVQNKFRITERKELVMESLNSVLNEARTRQIDKFNLISAWAVPFVLIATLFQMGIIKLGEIVSLDGTSANIGWFITFIIIALLIYWIHKWGQRNGK